MSEKSTAQQILKLIGGKENLASAAHCATRLRLVLNDTDIADTAAIEDLDLVKGVFTNSGQYQIIIGTGIVNRVFEHFAAAAGITEASTAEVATQGASKNPIQAVARTLSNIFVPIIPAIVASGLCMGVLGYLKTNHLIDTHNFWYYLLDMSSSAAFIILPILIGFVGAKVFGGTPILGATLGGILTHPDLVNAWTIGHGFPSVSLFGFHIGLVGYQGTVFPMLMAVWFMCKMEKLVRKVVPNTLDIILSPFLVLTITGFVSLVAIGPFGRLLGNGISTGLMYLYTHAGVLAGFVFGGTYSMIVITGIHQSFHAIELGLLGDPKIGFNFLLPIWSMANVAQGGACFAVIFKKRDKKVTALALPSAISAILGITEPAIFGVNLRYMRPFLGGLVGGAIGGAYVVYTKVGMTSVGLTGIPGLAIVRNGSVVDYITGFAIAFLVGFIASYLLTSKKTAPAS
ncbi:sucrose-specific PTS transporter subunit IIBC [Celerinatantimonas diazotrophica]|uniref:PTS system sucrose-specific IIB component (Glc family) /PTS system sucrose-specific IIC component (Glc family) n=1 Tax=Celerinatantimonas diazotrophica TaxID=412034 RepID=A0A4R1JBN8_9GAMM|nr:sucrose-specific PTS transporter subunit IIBC [Celerinatantimonas diazotrophica]TCK47569.1 PTS system sucrose-specific IIB component (Glc family) /PTS system sucrose-specific IIC component (Glc family) [Celerinatantimonas diazotrophica]CAG9296808.1 Negative regulator of SacY activity [Celerinatantimonas diazotrophica]